MKVFSRDKYEYVGIQKLKGRCYFMFSNIQKGFSTEIVLVKEAKLIYPPKLGYTYFHEEDLPDYLLYAEPSPVPQVISLSSVIHNPSYLSSLAENERKWALRRGASEVESLTSDVIEEEGAARLNILSDSILNGILDAPRHVRES